MGATIAWYAAAAEPTDHRMDNADLGAIDSTADPAPPRTGAGPPPTTAAAPAVVADLVAHLTDPARRLSPAALVRTDPARLASPGLYAWWVDTEGATDLSAGAALGIGPGLAYAGLAGATRWPSGRRSTNTLWSRLTGMHLGNRAKFSTFRRTLAALLREPLALTSEDDPRLSDWIARHLAVSPIVVQDADALGRLETAVLHQLDPPLNLRGMPPTPLRTRISTLRTTHAPEQ